MQRRRHRWQIKQRLGLTLTTLTSNTYNQIENWKLERFQSGTYQTKWPQRKVFKIQEKGQVKQNHIF